MKQLLLLLFLIPNLAFALPACPSLNDDWNNCFGTYTTDKGDIYVGEWKDNKRYGQGTNTWSDGEKYTGEWKDDQRHGQGTHTWPDGQKYVGEYKDGKKHGQGAHTWPDGQKYVGEYKDGKKHGQGTHTFPDGEKYVGEYKDGKKHGQGTYTFPDGEKYAGEWKDNKIYGQGTNTWPDGQKYTGEWKDDQRHGQGTNTWPDGQKYVGEYKDDKKHGQGTHTFPDGEKYTGEWKDDEANGQGTNTWPDGEKYAGEWRDDQRHGQGTHTWPNGEKYAGEWINDQFVTSKVAETDQGYDPKSQLNEELKLEDNNNSDNNKLLAAASGTGFAISKDGYILTNNHVISGCQALSINVNDRMVSVKLIASDPLNDLAIIKGDFKPQTIFYLDPSTPKLLDDIYVAGYPFGYDINNSIKITKGIVSSLSGLGNNFSNMQIDAAIQPGNSGGPVLNKKGKVIGVVVAKLNMETVYKDYGVIPENTNFAIKSSVAKNFAESNDIRLIKKNLYRNRSLGKYISNGTYYLSCMMTMTRIKEMQTKKVFFQNITK